MQEIVFRERLYHDTRDFIMIVFSCFISLWYIYCLYLKSICWPSPLLVYWCILLGVTHGSLSNRFYPKYFENQWSNKLSTIGRLPEKYWFFFFTICWCSLPICRFRTHSNSLYYISLFRCCLPFLHHTIKARTHSHQYPFVRITSTRSWDF